MKKQRQDHTRLAVGLCVLMLAICFACLGRYLAPVLHPAKTNGDSFGMVLIDIDNQDTAASYHVQDYGVYVLAVRSASPADLAGVSSGDLLISVNNTPVRNTNEYVALQNGFSYGENVVLCLQSGDGDKPYDITMVWKDE